MTTTTAIATAPLHAWVLDAHPDQPNLSHIPVSMLAELYPNLYQFGPRGDLYVTQLAAIVAQLNQIDHDNADPKDFLVYFRAAGQALEIAIYGNYLHTAINPLIKQYQYPSTDLAFLMEAGDPDDTPANPSYAISNHPVWQRTFPVDNEDFLYALEQLTYATLYYPLFAAVRDAHITPDLTAEVVNLFDLYGSFCTRWGIPA